MHHRPYIREIPGSETAILCIHGIIGTPDHFTRFLPLIPENWTIHNILLDGHGGSVQDFSASSMQKWREQASKEVELLLREHRQLVIAAHSMGTFFAIDAAIRYPKRVRGLFLMAPPLYPRPTPEALRMALAVAFDRIHPEDTLVVRARAACSIDTTWRLWEYIGWVPRYLELFRESRTTGNRIGRLSVPCRAFFSKQDELVSLRSMAAMRQNPQIRTILLKNSTHFGYDPADELHLLEEFRMFCREI